MKSKSNLISIFLVIGFVVIGVGYIIYSVASAEAFTGGHSPSHSNVLTNSSVQQVAQAALDRVGNDFVIRSGRPKVVLSKSVTRDELPALNLPTISRASIEEPPLVLVIIKDDFGASKRMGIGKPANEHYKYIAYIFDLWAGYPTWTLASPEGGEFRKALNDPMLPIVTVPTSEPFSASPDRPHHYGEIAPPVPDPTR